MNNVNIENWRLLMVACEWRHENIVRRLCQVATDIQLNCRNNIGRTALYSAMQYGSKVSPS